MIELGLLGAQTDFDVAQAFPIGELREGHAQLLIEAREALEFVLSVIACDAPTEGVHGQVIDYLRENGLAGGHEPSS